MEACFKYLGCDKKDCVMHGQKDSRNCWEVTETLCNHKGIQFAREEFAGTKEDACAMSGCIYYKAAKINNGVGPA